jgi:hypothetical protein
MVCVSKTTGISLKLFFGDGQLGTAQPIGRIGFCRHEWLRLLESHPCLVPSVHDRLYSRALLPDKARWIISPGRFDLFKRIFRS